MIARQKWIEKGRAKFAGQRVLFLLPIAEPGGGGNVVITEAMAMREMGVDVRIFNLNVFRQRFERAYPTLEIPVLYGEREHLVTLANEYNAVIATLNSSVEWLRTVIPLTGSGHRPRGDRPVRGYYVQGFEPYMYEPGTEGFQIAWASYTLFPDLVRFTKTEWTRQEVRKQIGVECAVVGPSVNICLFRPRPRYGPEWPARSLRIAAMVRSSSPYREPKLTMELLQQASRHYRGRVEIVILGISLGDPGFAELPRDFAWRLAGVLTQQQVAHLLNEVDIFVDFSSHQAMGLTALEAMACGAAVIVPERGGAISFARHEENSLVVDTSSREACWRALQGLIEDHHLRSRLQRNAPVGACDLFPERPAFNILNVLFSSEEPQLS
jgi:glycosyltransferase involved in cell wall biosynthesis